MKIMMIVKYPPIQGGVSADTYWTAQMLTEMGHEIHIVTNADEVEDEYRITMTSEDTELLTGYRIPGSITLHRSHVDRQHVFIPQTNPTASKLAGIALDVARRVGPDLIWAYYVEPYGIAALLASKILSIPYIIRHAGSDIGRLMLTEQLAPLYYEVFKHALAVLTGPSHFDMFRAMGVSESQLVQAVGVKVPADIFFPTESRQLSDELIVGSYGKVGRSKGTTELLSALAILKERGLRFQLRAHWGGRDIKEFVEQLRELNLENCATVESFIPHWKIPTFIRSCDVLTFLENNFSIKFHGPSIPLECLACGRPLLATEEVARKQPRLLRADGNCIVIPSSPLKSVDIANAIEKLNSKIRDGWLRDVEWPDSGLVGVRIRKQMEELITCIKHKLDSLSHPASAK